MVHALQGASCTFFLPISLRQLAPLLLVKEFAHGRCEIVILQISKMIFNSLSLQQLKFNLKMISPRYGAAVEYAPHARTYQTDVENSELLYSGRLSFRESQSMF